MKKNIVIAILSVFSLFLFSSVAYFVNDNVKAKSKIEKISHELQVYKNTNKFANDLVDEQRGQVKIYQQEVKDLKKQIEELQK